MVKIARKHVIPSLNHHVNRSLEGFIGFRRDVPNIKSGAENYFRDK